MRAARGLLPDQAGVSTGLHIRLPPTIPLLLRDLSDRSLRSPWAAEGIGASQTEPRHARMHEFRFMLAETGQKVLNGYMADEVRDPRSSWTFLTQHARVLLMISQDADVRVRDLAAATEMTERAVQAVLGDLEKAGYVTRARVGRRNHYRITRGTHFRHPAEARHEIAGLLTFFAAMNADADTHAYGEAGEGNEDSTEP